MSEREELRLKRIVADHETWLGSEGKEGKQADLDSANLQSASLPEADLSRANIHWSKPLGKAVKYCRERLPPTSPVQK